MRNRDLYTVLKDVVFYSKGWIEGGGRVVEDDSAKPGVYMLGRVGFRTRTGYEKADFPSVLDTYLAGTRVEKLNAYPVAMEFWAESGRIVRCKATVVIISVDAASAAALRALGLGMFLPKRIPHIGRVGFGMLYLDLSANRRLEAFLRGAGVRLKEYTPPWFEPGTKETGVKPSSRRPGSEDARFLGFSY